MHLNEYIKMYYNSNFPLISVIIPVYKVENYIRNCIESVQNQTYTHWELILVDDGSPDNSGKICDEYQSADDRIKVIHQQNGGQANARNHALDVCRGKYVTFLDSDDFLHKYALAKMVETALSNEADLVQFDFVRGIEKSFPEINKTENISQYDNHSIFLSGKANVIVCGKLIKLEIVDSNRIREGKFYEDDFTTWKWYYHSKRIVVSNRPFYYYTENPQSTMAKHQKKPSFDFIEAYDERIGFFKDRSEKDLEDCSHLQLCKSLLLTYSNKSLSQEERNIVKQRFDESWQELKHSPYISKFYKRIFELFYWIPMITSKMAVKLKS